MAVVVNNAISVQSTSGTTVTFSYTSGSLQNRLLVVSNIKIAAITNSGTYAGQALTNVSGSNLVTTLTRVNPATGSNTMSFSLASYGFTRSIVSNFSGVDQITPISNFASNSATTATPTSTSRTCPPGGILVGAFRGNYNTSGTPTGGSGTTSFGAGRQNGFMFGGGHRATSGSLSWNIAQSTYCDMHILAVNPVAESNPVKNKTPLTGPILAQ